MDPFCADTGVGWLTAEFELSFFAVGGALRTSGGALVTRVAGDTHPAGELECAKRTKVGVVTWRCGNGLVTVVSGDESLGTSISGGM
jgi:hypothetical protein